MSIELHPEPPMVRVEWIDSGNHKDAGWGPKEKYLEDVHEEIRQGVLTVGYLMHADDDLLVVALSWDPYCDAYYGAQIIYKPCVKSVTRIPESHPLCGKRHPSNVDCIAA